MKVGYARVSSIGQNLQSQIDALEAYGCEKIFQEKVSGTSTKGRDEFKEMLNFVRENDEVVVTRLDRCSRSVLDMQLIHNYHSYYSAYFNYSVSWRREEGIRSW